MASAWKYGNTMKADIKKTINKIIFTQAKTFSKALIKKLNTTPWSRFDGSQSLVQVLDPGPNAETAHLHWNSRNMKKTRFTVMDRRHINIWQIRDDSVDAVFEGKRKISRQLGSDSPFLGTILAFYTG